MRAPRGTRRTRARLAPELHLVETEAPETTAPTSAPVTAPTSRLGNRATEALLTRLRARLADDAAPPGETPEALLSAPRQIDDPADTASALADLLPSDGSTAAVLPGPDDPTGAGAVPEPESPEAAAPEADVPAPDLPADAADAADTANAEEAAPLPDLAEDAVPETAPQPEAQADTPDITLPTPEPAAAPEPAPDAGTGASDSAPAEPGPLAPGPELAAWHARTVGAAAAIPAPPQPTAAAAAPALRTGGAGLRTARAPRRASIRTEAEAAISEPPEPVEAPPEPPPDPVPEANTLVEATGGQLLTAVTMPNLNPSPEGSQPLAIDPAARRPPPEPAPAAETPGLASDPATTTAPTPADATALSDVADAARAPVPDLPPGSAEGVTITDTPPEPRAPLPEGLQPDMTQILARLLENPEAQARPILTDARNDAYPNNVLPRAFQDIGDDMLPDLTGQLTSALNLIAEDSGIAAGELSAAVAARRAEVEAAALTSSSELDAVCSAETESLSSESSTELGEVSAAEDAQNLRSVATVEAATGEGSPEVINARRDAQVRKLNRNVGDLRFGYDRARDRRHAALDRARQLQEQAYDRTRDSDVAALRTGDEASHVARTLRIGAVGLWATNQKNTLRTTVEQRKTEATTQAAGFSTATTNAGSTATRMVFEWAAALTGETRSWWQEIWARMTNWSQQAEIEAANWSAVRAGEARDATVQNMGLLQQFRTTQGEAVDLETNAAFQTLSAEQQAVIRAYYAAPAGSRDGIGAVAAGLAFRLSQQQKPAMIEKLQKAVMDKPDSEWRQLEQIGAAQTSGFSARAISDELHEAMFGGVTGWGTDEDQIYRNLSGLTALQGRAVRATYRTRHGSDLDSDLSSELDGDNALVRAQAALNGDPVLEAVGALNEAMAGLGTDEDTIMRMLRGKTAEQRAAITAEYRRRYGVDLNAELDSEMDDHDQDRAQALLAGDTARADAIALDQAMHGGILGWGTDEAQIESVYSDVRNDVAAMQVPDGQGGMRRMTQEEMEAEILRRNAEVEVSYDTRYGTPGDQQSALRAAYADELSGPDLDLATALADNDLAAADAARLERERQGFYADDAVINGVLETQYSRALDALQRDPEWTARSTALQRRAAEEGWDPYRLAEAERTLNREMEEAARVGAQQNMAALEDAYDTRYSRWGSGGLQVLIAFNMSGSDQDKARALVEQGGYLTRAQRFDFATRGVGTDEDDARRALAGATAAEIAEIDRARAARGQPSVTATIEDEMDGRDRFDTLMLARGVPENAAEEMAQSRDRAQWELRNSPVGGHERDVLARDLRDMEAQYALINDPDADPFLRQRALDQFRLQARGVQSGVDVYRRRVDAVTDAVATVAALTAAITVTVLTGGVAGAVLGALAAAAATMMTKAALKGGAYGADEMALDAVVGIVDAAAAYATFGMGNALLRMATSQGGRVARLGSTRVAATLARMAGSASRTQRMLAHGVSEAIEGAAGALPSALAGNMLDDKNWQGNPLTNILGGTLMETGMGALVSGGMGSFGGLRAPRMDPPVPRTGDILAHRGTPRDRLDAWRAYRADNPDANMGDFLRRYDDQIADRLQAEARDATVQRTLRTELYSGIPPRQRRLFKDVEIEVMSDADFHAFTRSDSGNAVTIIENGRPKVIIRDGAPPHVLREEGLHLTQILDPDLGRLARRLDETRLRDWDSLSIGEQMELYSIKIELEIDAQIRLIDGLDADIHAARPGVDLDALARQRAAAQDSLTNLRRRADEVAREGPLERIAMARGLRDPPPYLDQPARLFSKDGKGALLPRVKDRPGSINVGGTEIHGTFSTRGSSKVLRAPEGGTVRFEMELPDGTVHEFGLDGNQLRRRQIEPSTGAWADVDTGTVVEGRLRYSEADASGAMVPRTEPMTFEVTGKREIYINREYFTPHAVQPGGLRVAPEELARSYSDAALTPLGWRQSGSSINRKGDIAELASSMRSQRHVADATSPVLASLSVQRPGGTGFDGVELVIDANGVPFLRIIEVKNYATHVPFEDITAVTRRAGTGDNLQANLLDLETRTRPTLDELDQARRRLDAEAAADADYDDPIGQGWFGRPADDGGMGLEDWYDMAAGGDSMAERALADQAARQADMADRIVAERLGISVENLHLMREALGNLKARQNFELEFRLAGGAELGGDVARTASGAPQPHTTRARVEADWQGTGRVRPTETLTDAEYAAAEAIHDAATGTSGFHSHIQATGHPDVQFIDADGNMLALQRPNQSACQNPEGIAADIAARLRTTTRIPPNDAGLPFVALDLADSIGDKATLKAQIEAALNDIDPPLTTTERIRLIYLNDPV